LKQTNTATHYTFYSIYIFDFLLEMVR